MATAYRLQGETRAELAARVAQLRRDQTVLSVGELCRRVDALRGQAARGGFAALARLAGGLGDALAAHGRAATTGTYLDLMGDALDSPALEADALLAAASVRLA